MDRDAAERSVLAMLERGGDRLPQRTAFQAGRYYLVLGKKDKALISFAREDSLSPTGLTRMFTALTADMTGNTNLRGESLEALATKTVVDPGYKEIGKRLGEWFELAEPPEEETILTLLSRIPTASRIDAEFFVGWCLHHRGLPGRATVYWKRCLDAVEGTKLLKVHAQILLREISSKRD